MNRLLSLLSFLCVATTVHSFSVVHPRSAVSPSLSSKTTTPPQQFPRAALQQSKQQQYHSTATLKPSTTSLNAESGNNSPAENSNKLPIWLDPGTKGGAVFLSLLLFIAPIIVNNVVLAVTDLDPLDVGVTIGVGFTVFATLGWVSTYIFRVATKDMTYAKQLKDYENAVIAKRLEELDEDEIQALVEEVDKDDF
mmetsp:Transcript_8562/g.11300  ORF Transcript_8562/g.11300 Transcript_8562/m.11300 type:complete len:195 (+) Transcript_8562:229-813(+)|eukprot:CAMPEP_0198136964 /NCGR_PEP_ID=MMETSP1443-20131203/520_1 /TAXON_ID=186043 /ORGANISM="Entomoneis sp., Strain CCMP2396" /LENGTH=194 /DNA_ID=CAMNT_0043798273 /DNA_START=192 /DNA_END=776 /DNA_ORIENTATION=-